MPLGIEGRNDLLGKIPGVGWEDTGEDRNGPCGEGTLTASPSWPLPHAPLGTRSFTCVFRPSSPEDYAFHGDRDDTGAICEAAPAPCT